MRNRGWLAIGLACFLGACGDDDGAATPDAGTNNGADASTPDAGADAPPAIDTACAKILNPAGTISAVPGEFSGTIAGATSMVDLTACTEENTPFGIGFPGPEQVVEISGLTAGTEYAIRVTADFDSGFYVVSGCAGDTLTTGECLNVVDQETAAPEAGIVAPASGTVYVIIDHYQDELEAGGAYTVDVYEKQCDTLFDCSTAAAPLCSTFQCVAGPDECTGDDANEPNDGPGGATDLTPTEGVTSSLSAGICSQPRAERDWYQFTITEEQQPADATITVTFDGAAADLDVYLYDAQGRNVGFTFYAAPETVALTYLPAGTYYIEVDQFDPPGAAAVTAYDIELTLNVGVTGCQAVSDCAAEYHHQAFRGECAESGACVFIEGEEQLALAALCDTSDDCDPATADFCTADTVQLFVPNAEERAFCSVTCADDAACESTLGSADYKCTAGFQTNFCLRACTVDEECPILFNTEGDWAHTVCDEGGHCVPPPPPQP